MSILPVSSFSFKSKNNLSTTSVSYYQNYLSNSSDKVSFTGIMPNSTKKAIKMCVFDLDETLLEGPQNIRNRVMAFAKRNDRILVYSSARPLRKVQPLIDAGTLAMPDWCVCNNGVNIYKNIDGKFEEIGSWYQSLMKNFDKGKIREMMVGISKKHMFTPEEWAKVQPNKIPKGQREFLGSKITEYESFGEDSNIRFMMVPGLYDKTVPTLEKMMVSSGVEASVTRQLYGREELNPGFLEKYFPFEIAEGIRNHHIPRMDSDGSVEVAIVTLKSDKGKATEYIRNQVGLRPQEIFASGDAENDFEHTNKGYFFAMISNASEGLKKLVSQSTKTNIIEAPKPGVEGIYEVIRA